MERRYNCTTKRVVLTSVEMPYASFWRTFVANNLHIARYVRSVARGACPPSRPARVRSRSAPSVRAAGSRWPGRIPPSSSWLRSRPSNVRPRRTRLTVRTPRTKGGQNETWNQRERDASSATDRFGDMPRSGERSRAYEDRVEFENLEPPIIVDRYATRRHCGAPELFVSKFRM